MIAFASQFIGLLVGVMPVTVMVDKPVAAVVFELDGRPVGRLAAPPWTLRVDFGSEPLPHDLTVKAFDREGSEVGSARQFVNLPRPPAEVEILLEKDANGNAVAAKFAGQSFFSTLPPKATVRLDGKPLSSASNRVELPPYDTQRRHVLSVELEFTPSVRSRADVAFGGGESSVIKTDLTALAVRAKPRRDFPEASALTGAFLHGDRALQVVAVDNGPALAEFVRNPSIARAARILRSLSYSLPSMTNLWPEDRVRIMWPVARPVPQSPGAFLFESAGDFGGRQLLVHQLLTRIEYSGPAPGELRIADAVGAAGLDAITSASRRAVVLVLGGETADGSRDSPEAVRRYLEAIRVPLFVWSLGKPAAQPLARAWGSVTDISSGSGLGLVEAVDALKRELASQRIVWVQGRFLPQDVTIAATARDIEFAR